MPGASGLPRALRAFLLVLVSLTVVCIGTELLCIWLGLGYPYNFPLLPYVMRLQDIGWYNERYDHYHSRMFYDLPGQPNLYPAPATIVYKLLFLTGHAGVFFVGIVSLSIVAFSCWFGRELRLRGLSRSASATLIGLTALCSYPFAFEFRQGNLEGLLWSLLALSIVLFLRGRYVSAAVGIGILASMKLYPFALVGLLLAKRRYREVLLSIFAAISMTLAGLWLACPDLAYSWKRTQEGISLFQSSYSLPVRSIGFDHSLFALCKRVLYVVADHTGQSILALNESALYIYLPFAALLGFYVCFVRTRSLPIVNQVICTVSAMLLLPPTSFDYTLVHLYVPWALLACSAVEYRHYITRGRVAAFACLAVILAPESELIFHYIPVGGQIKAVALVCLIVIAVKFPFDSSFDNDPVTPTT